MFNNNNNKRNKGIRSAQTRNKISQSLKGKAKKLRQSANTAVRRGAIKGAGAAGYVAGRAGAEVATRPTLRSAAGKGVQAASKLSSKIPKKNNTSSAPKPKLSLRNKVTATRATGAFVGGAGKGAYKGISSAQKRKKNNV
jgi:dsDNA-specific endonuclease/ATPase MutS2